MAITLKLKRGTEAQVLSAVLVAYEPVYASDTGSLYIYDGVSKKIVGNLLSGTHDNRPVFGVGNRLYYETDTGKMFWDSGLAWVQASSSASHGSEAHTGTIGLEASITFHASSGHKHTGTDSTKVVYTDLASIPSTFTPAAHGSSAHTGSIGAWGDITSKPTTFAPTNHNLVDTTGHPVSGLTENHVLRATGATAYGFGTIPSTVISDWAEAVADQVGSMVSGNTETNISVSYDDADNTLDFEITSIDGGAIA